ncbi:MAG: Maltose-binding periplasmic protein precursor [Lentisphaerae bacterium ADurb.Bin242]|nr:MAG: Maltose-binding periplasmic protein precursor [Lentisphaerae bacterium ADurb.Bin242]
MKSKNTVIRNYVLGLMESGSCSGGDKIPAARDLAVRLGISQLTVQNALETMNKEGLLKVVPRQGTYVSEEWTNRILQSSISAYIAWKRLPWGEYFLKNIPDQIPQLHCSIRMPRGVFEIVPTSTVLMNQDQYLDLELLLDRCFPDKSDFHAEQFDSFRCKGRLVGLPFLFSPRVMLYNPRILKKNGCPVPSPDYTWEDFLGCVRRLGKRLPAENVFVWNASYYNWMTCVLRAGGSLIDPNAEDPVKIDSPATRHGLKLFRDLRYALGVEMSSSYEDMFEKGKTAFAIGARQVVGRLKQNGVHDWNVLPLPRIPGGCDTSLQATELLCVRKECVDMECAKALIRFFLSEAFQKHLAELKYAIPIRKSVLQPSNDPHDILFEREVLKVHSRHHLDSPELFRLVCDGIHDLLTGDADIEEGTAELAGMLRVFIRITRGIPFGKNKK